MFRVVIAFSLTIVAVRATAEDNAAPILKRLEESKGPFKAEREKFNVKVLAWFGQQEDEARKTGNKKVVEAVFSARKSFVNTGVPFDSSRNGLGRDGDGEEKPRGRLRRGD